MADDRTRPTGSPSVSVVVPCAGVLDHIRALVDSLVAQDATFAWEAIFVDNNLSTAERSRLAAEIEALPGAQIVSEGAPGISPARNAGVARARGDIVAFIDADDVAASTWLRGLVGGVDEGTIAAGHLDLDRLNPPWLAQTRGAKASAEPYRCEGVFPVAPGGNMAMRKQDYTSLGGLDGSWPTLEDFELCFRAWREGMQVRPAGASATVHYRLRRDRPALLRQGYRYGQARARMYRTLFDEQLVPRGSWAGWKSWVLLMVRMAQGVVSSSKRAAAMWILGNRLGRLAGSIRYRVIYV